MTPATDPLAKLASTPVGKSLIKTAALQAIHTNVRLAASYIEYPGDTGAHRAFALLESALTYSERAELTPEQHDELCAALRQMCRLQTFTDGAALLAALPLLMAPEIA